MKSVSNQLCKLLGKACAALALISLTCCGGGGSGGGGGPPTISSLRYSPTSVVQGPGNATITGSVDFSSPDGNLATLNLSTSAGASQSIPVPGGTGKTTGTLTGSFMVSSATRGHYTFQVWVVDSQGRSSNHLSGTFDVLLNDIAASWTQQQTGTQSALNRVIWTGTQFVVVGYSGTVLTSPDGTNWTPRNSGTSAVLSAVAWSGSRLVAVGFGNSTTVLTSTDGVSWSPVNSLPVSSTTTLTSITWSGTQFVAIGVDSSVPTTAVILQSSDGLSWTSTTVQAAPVSWVTWTGTQFVAVGANVGTPVILRSTDGRTWTPDTISGGANGSLGDVASAGTTGNPTIVAVGDLLSASSSPVALTSVAGGAWQTVTPTGSLVGAVGWSGSHFLACGVVTCALSADGLNWTNASGALPFPVAIGSIVWGGPGDGRWVAIAMGSLIATSP
jgi:hypothetical protein